MLWAHALGSCSGIAGSDLKPAVLFAYRKDFEWFVSGGRQGSAALETEARAVTRAHYDATGCRGVGFDLRFGE